MPQNQDKRKKVLLVSPDYLGLYNDIYRGLINLGYDTELIITKTLRGDPFLVFNKNQSPKSEEDFLNELKEFWIALYKSGEYSFDYDYLIAIDGTCLHPYLFEQLQDKSPNIKKINYLFDGIDNVYRFDRNFPFFDKIYTFDLSDSKKYNIAHLPIYWVDNDEIIPLERDVFAFGAYNKIRSGVFKYIKDSLPSQSVTSYIKLFVPQSHAWNSRIKTLVKNLLMPKQYGMISHTPLSTDDFRKMIATSRIVVDTSNGYQDGLSARFMWALGLGKKIITNNSNVMTYDFYSKEQIFVIGYDTYSLSDFVKSDFKMTDEVREKVNSYRIDNWLNTLLDKK